ncbi:hypothetical protein GGX14DRAFT_404483 [Mycena pura]|uniref:Uncharacterized protein n=1 Tax=Mycena pura TaxID=153505 RepID=A0AAD6UVQ3_9AGAR|nr:hypothetical protein GGX14DRAFT_404483 [Mycena pura]
MAPGLTFGHRPKGVEERCARAHRIGQTKEVQYLLTHRTAQDRIRRKLFLSAKIIGAEAGGAGEEQNADGPQGGRELMAILRRGSSALTRSDGPRALPRGVAAGDPRRVAREARAADGHRERGREGGGAVVAERGGGGEGAAERRGAGAELPPAKNVGVLSLTPQKKRERVHRTVSIGGTSFIVDDSMVEVMILSHFLRFSVLMGSTSGYIRACLFLGAATTECISRGSVPSRIGLSSLYTTVLKTLRALSDSGYIVELVGCDVAKAFNPKPLKEARAAGLRAQLTTDVLIDRIDMLELNAVMPLHCIMFLITEAPALAPTSL